MRDVTGVSEESGLEQRPGRRELRAVRWPCTNAAANPLVQLLWPRKRAGVWGRHRRLEATCQAQALIALCRDRVENDSLIFAHLEDRCALHERIARLNEPFAASRQSLRQDIDVFSSPDHEKRCAMLEQFRRRTAGQNGRDDDGGPGATDRIRALRRLCEDSPSSSEPEREI